MAVHGRYGEPCPRCGEEDPAVFCYADNENQTIAPAARTGGKVLADRSLVRDYYTPNWPRHGWKNLKALEAALIDNP